jgi:hypothetical protein
MIPHSQLIWVQLTKDIPKFNFANCKSVRKLGVAIFYMGINKRVKRFLAN